MSKIVNNWAKFIEYTDSLDIPFITREQLINRKIGDRLFNEPEKRDYISSTLAEDRKYALNRMAKESGKIVLELGCGKGGVFQSIDSTKTLIRKYIGIDSDMGSISMAKKINFISGKGIFLVHDITQPDFIPFLNSALKLKSSYKFFDSVIINQVLEHIDERDIFGLLSTAEYLTKESIFITVPNIESIKILSHFMLFPEQVIYQVHKLFFTPRSLERMLHRGIEKPKNIEVIPYLRFGETLSKNLFYHIFSKVSL